MADLQDQITALRARWEAEPNSRVFVQLAEAYRRSGHPKQALEVLRQGLTSVPDYLSGQVALGRCYLDLNKPEAAVEVLERVLKRDPTHLVASKHLIRAHIDGGNVSAARERLDQYRLLNDGDPVIEELEQSIRDLQKPASATAAAQDIDATVRLEALVAEAGVRKPPTPAPAAAPDAAGEAAPTQEPVAPQVPQEPHEPAEVVAEPAAVQPTDTVLLSKEALLGELPRAAQPGAEAQVSGRQV